MYKCKENVLFTVDELKLIAEKRDIFWCRDTSRKQLELSFCSKNSLATVCLDSLLKNQKTKKKKKKKRKNLEKQDNKIQIS